MRAFSIVWYVAVSLFLGYGGWLLTFKTKHSGQAGIQSIPLQLLSEALVFNIHALHRNLHLAVDSPN
jgi:hypothetical protein